MTAMIEARGVRKRFGNVQALAGLDLRLEHGEVTALLGPNGAGKTTFVRALATLIRPDAGELRVAGHDVVREPRQVRAAIGLAGQHAAVEGAMTGRENLEMIARLYGSTTAAARSRASDVIEQLQLAEVADRLVRTYSGGQRRRLDLGASLVGSPRVLLLDEPTTGLDPRSRIELWDAIRALRERGTEVLLTTQYLDEADRLASRIVIIDHGRVIADGTPSELKSLAGGDVIEVHTQDPAQLFAAASALARLFSVEPSVDAGTRRVSVPASPDSGGLGAAISALHAAGVAIEDIAMRRPTLDEVFLALTGQDTGQDTRPGAGRGTGPGADTLERNYA